ncbi:TonB-dependent receptor [Porticoccus sp. GXU_MW_L64]
MLNVNKLVLAVAVSQAIPIYVMADSSLEEIVVTAQRRAENLQDVPISVSALPESFLEKNDVRSLQDLSGAVPGFYATNSVNYGAAPLTIRGIGGANGGGNFFNDEPVAVYVNDVYISRLSFSTADLLDVKNIEVLRGPQGTLYGRNSSAGALLLRTARPTEETEGFVRGTIAEFGEQRIQAAISGPLSESLQGRLALGRTDIDGWGNNSFDGSDVAASEATTARLSLRYSPSDTFTGDLILETQRQDSVPATIAVASVAPLTPSTPFVRRPDLNERLDNNEFALNDPNFNEAETDSLTLLINWSVGNLTVDSVTAYRDYSLDGAQDSDGTEFTLFNNQGVVASEQFSQEIRLSSDNDSAFSWVVGAYYLQEDVTMDFTIRNFQGLFGAGTEATFDASQDLSSWAVFVDATWDITEQLSVSLGGRYSTEDKDFTNNQTVFTIGNSIPLPIPFGPFPAGATIPAGIPVAPPGSFASSETFSDFSPRLVASYALSENARVFASFTQAFKSGGFNSFGLAPAFDNEEIDAVEVGFKSELLGDRLRFNGAAFIYDYSNLQVRLPVPTGGVSIVNAGEAEVKGLELEMTLAASENLQISANVSFLDTELEEFLTQEIPEDLLFLIGAPIPLNMVNAAGNELTRAPDLQYAINLDYTTQLTDTLTLDFNLNYRHQDSVFFLETNQSSNTFASDGSDELGLRIAIGPETKKWQVGIFGQNITDERTITQVTALGGHPNAAINEPAKWGLDFRVNF